MRLWWEFEAGGLLAIGQRIVNQRRDCRVLHTSRGRHEINRSEASRKAEGRYMVIDYWYKQKKEGTFTLCIKKDMNKSESQQRQPLYVYVLIYLGSTWYLRGQTSRHTRREITACSISEITEDRKPERGALATNLLPLL